MSDTRQHPCPYFHNSSSKSGRLDQEVTSFEILRPSFKVRQIPDMETWSHARLATFPDRALLSVLIDQHRIEAALDGTLQYRTRRTVLLQ